MKLNRRSLEPKLVTRYTVFPSRMIGRLTRTGVSRQLALRGARPGGERSVFNLHIHRITFGRIPSAFFVRLAADRFGTSDRPFRTQRTDAGFHNADAGANRFAIASCAFCLSIREN